MKAVVIRHYGGPEVLEFGEFPDPVVGAGDVLVKVAAAGVNTRDVLNLVRELEEKGASLRVLEPAIDTGGPMGAAWS
jgi:NADPH:quinone reductase-like Zn-dependent oxidoreductase